MIEHQAQPARRKRGRPSKGPRVEVRAEVPIPLAELLEHDAREQGMTKTDRLTAILRDYYEMRDERGVSA
jgi:hypothetical protein